MKKLIYGVSFLALVGTFVIGCQKEGLKPNLSSQSSKEVKVDNVKNERLTNYRIFMWIGIGGGQVEPFCADVGGNCLPDFVVVGAVGTFDGFNDAITNATQSDYFTTNQVTDLFDMVEPSYIEGFQASLASGDMVFLREIAEDGTNYYILINAENTTLNKEDLVGDLVEIVIPIRFEE